MKNPNFTLNPKLDPKGQGNIGALIFTLTPKTPPV